ncbi:hypothetical protein FZI85_17265 [Mycobacterium sp. CBMA293]|uniref:VG15 protein n=1 Tax=unclassified Mycolicibacterium TaxID=2636767 RepID=UPI0012DE23D6|nr:MULTISPECIES: hypothetical protein [unclassified Mycolicibacterium]MUL44473.1 hypothetical protein [Mycolicibacterium sp. CBMA 360]MUL59793.1 hypothetical protein [Mycolicibacterium sp. CBMA 335]MUL68636.1 hypothetical protein [Mycolicibacterium sp. CBMA 311]MUL93973.1 hypothetical protein [Mycolicibacterium sp. CBMA 230]MUM06219.1 hypothetical protein [Mycolicibacterium sp. CBMA 213]
MPTLAEYVSVASAAATGDITPIFTGLAVSEAIAAMHDLLPSVTDTWALAAASIAADWYDNLRQEKAVKGRFSALVPDLGDLGAKQLADWAAQPLTLPEPNWDLARSRVEGGLQLRVTNSARETVMSSSLADPQAVGWQRVASTGGCGWCQMLAGRGFVYSQKSVKFGAHDHCHCSATPAFGGEPLPVKPYVPTSRNISDADRERAKAWIKNNL